MKHEFSENRRNLIITASEEERQELREWRDDETREWGTPSAEAEALESLTCNSELDWCDPSETGDLTDAPMLAIREEDPDGNPVIVERWAFMNYQLRTFLDDLTDTGKAVFVS
jgi:hypothetical protein